MVDDLVCVIRLDIITLPWWSEGVMVYYYFCVFPTALSLSGGLSVVVGGNEL